MSDYFIENLIDIPRWLYVVAFMLIFIFILVYRYFLHYNYIYFDDENNKIIIRYYHLKLFNKNFKSIEIPKNSFVKFEEKIFFLKQRHDLILYQKTNKGIAKYPPVSITALNKVQKKEIILSLNKTKANAK